jgi:hypothetical protein
VCHTPSYGVSHPLLVTCVHRWFPYFCFAAARRTVTQTVVSGSSIVPGQ